jgi:hypothetical protein
MSCEINEHPLGWETLTTAQKDTIKDHID